MGSCLHEQANVGMAFFPPGDLDAECGDKRALKDVLRCTALCLDGADVMRVLCNVYTKKWN